ncbi:hypothetical protein QBC46DRAFT_321372 [Diplogelasinospora grovesii]|uniref:DUF1308 domain-containing protein n=1 Tax=Diplogelasinospora grovesii TaxID=303347 RepID=A0AAN6N009_9PEZI|nr:hypothetical protein QBC46DRAFT_321372 [Diplogelasinospora grovesii]
MADLSALRAQAADMICRGDAWTDEINQLNALRQARGKTCVPGTPALLKFVPGEVRSVRNLLSRLDAISPDSDDGGGSPDHRDSELLPLVNKLQHSLTSNFPAAEVFWGIVKRCRGLVSLKREVSVHTFTPTCTLCSGVINTGNNPGRCPPIRRQSPKHLALVDAIVSDGEEWLRVIGLNERQVLMQMARMGWDWEEEEEEEEDEDDISILRSVRRLVSASAANPYNYKPPRIRVIFTRIRSGGQSPDIDLLINQLRSLPYVTVDCSDSQFLRSPVPDWETVAVERLMLDDMKGLTSTLNIDTTILINLASDISHTRVEIQEWHKPLIIQQIHSELSEEEEEGGGGGGTLHKKLYPALVGRRLVVTRPAAAQFLGIVRQIGSETENQRARLILDTNTDLTGDMIKSEGAAAGGWSGKRGDELRRGLQQLSIYPVPGDLHLPIQVIDTSTTDTTASEGSPGVGDEEREMERMSSVLRQLTRLNREVFLFGWRSGYTTVTGNNEAVKTIIRAIEDRSKRNKNKGEEGVVMMQGPTVWVYPYMRALITKGPPPQT